MKTCRDCEHFKPLEIVVDGVCMTNNTIHHIDDGCDVKECLNCLHGDIDINKDPCRGCYIFSNWEEE